MLQMVTADCVYTQTIDSNIPQKGKARSNCLRYARFWSSSGPTIEVKKRAHPQPPDIQASGVD